MATKVQYRSPDIGAEMDVAPANISSIRDLILEMNEEYWNSGCGQGAFFASDGRRLLLTFHKGCGFFLEYSDGRTCMVSLGEVNCAKEKVVVYVGGNAMVVPGRFFVPRELAWEAVKEFCATGKRTDKVTWGSEKDWDYMWESHPELFERDEQGNVRERATH